MGLMLLFCVVAALHASNGQEPLKQVQGTFDALVPTYEQTVKHTVISNDIQGENPFPEIHPIEPSAVLVGQEETPEPIQATHKILTTVETDDQTELKPEDQGEASTTEASEPDTTTAESVQADRPAQGVATFSVQPLVPLQLALPDDQGEQSTEEAQNGETGEQSTEQEEPTEEPEYPTDDAPELEVTETEIPGDAPEGQSDIGSEDIQTDLPESDVEDSEIEAELARLNEPVGDVVEQDPIPSLDELAALKSLEPLPPLHSETTTVIRAKRQDVTYGGHIEAPVELPSSPEPVLAFDPSQFYTNNQQLVAHNEEVVQQVFNRARDQPEPVEPNPPVSQTLSESAEPIQGQPVPEPFFEPANPTGSDPTVSTPEPDFIEPTDPPAPPMPRIQIPPNHVCLLPLDHPCNSAISECICSEGMFCEYGRCALETGFATVDVYRAPTPKFVPLAQPDIVRQEIERLALHL